MLGPFATASRRYIASHHPAGVASRTPAIAITQAACDVHDNNNDNAWQRGPLWPHRMGPITRTIR